MSANIDTLHRQRVIAALEHRTVDRVPLTFGGPSCSIHRQAHDNLLKHLGITAQRPAPIIDSILQIVEPDAQLIERFDIDLLWLLPSEAPVEWSDDGQRYSDELGRTFMQGGEFFNQVTAPLHEGTESELAAYKFPDLRQYPRTAGLGEKAKRFYAAGYGLGVDGPWGIYEICSSLRGTQELYMDMLLNPNYVEALADRVLEEHHMPFYSLLLEAIDREVQMVVISDDLGSQQRLLFSPKVFRQIFKPRLRRLVEHIHSLTGAKVYMHSDGAISEIIPDLIEIGLEGLNPVQYTAHGMDTAELKRKFGRDLGFFGGTIDNEVLSYSTPDEVRRVVQEQVRLLAPEGGFLFASNHNISPEVPPENILALFDAGREFGAYFPN